jgi:hypothetical protein
MQDIEAGDEVYACDPQGGLTPTPVTRHWQSGFKPVRAIATRSRVLRVSDDHPVLAVEVGVIPRGESKSLESKSRKRKRKRKRGRLCWKRAAEIQARDIIVCAESYYEHDEALGRDRARLAGAFLGDGWVRHDTSHGRYTHGRYTVGLAIGGLGESHTQRYLDLLQGVLPPARWSVCAPGAYGLTCASARVWREIETLQLRAKSKQKRVPPWAFRLPLLEKLALLAGYVDADGCVADARTSNAQTSNHGRATLASTNRELLCDLRELAISCGLQITPIISALMRSNFGATVAHRCVLSADSANRVDSANRLELWHERKTRNKRATRYQKPRGLQSSAIGYLELPRGCFAQRVLSVSHSQVAQPVYDLTVEHSSHSFVVEGVVVHNCWREPLANGEEAYVHRKGATPAGAGVLGVIPGSMGDPGYVVKGKGLPESISSASHGAGRKLGRKAAIAAITKKMRDEYLKARGVTLLGGGLDESPQAYKDIEVVIAAQEDLVEVLGKFTPRIVKMASEAGDV